MLSIRPFAVADYPAYTRIKHDAVAGGHSAFSEAVYRQRDASRDPAFHFARFIAERDGVPVGFATAMQPPDYYAPGRWVVDVGVAANARGVGVGRALVRHLEGYLADFEVDTLWAGAVEDSAGHAFATRRGFVLGQREAFARLDLHAFDPAPFAGLATRMASQGVVIESAKAIIDTDPDAYRRWWDINWAAEQDIPASGEPTPLPFEVFMKYFEAPWFDPNAWFVAREGLEWVGITGLKPTVDPALWQTAMTGVLRTHRRRGIATALKARAVAHARRQGGRWIRTENEENNPMLAINLRFGFEECGAWLDLEKRSAARARAEE